MIIASWNVNSIRQRLEHLLDYLRRISPDVLCLQELKCVDEAFPTAEIEALGYNCAVHGQKAFNGVALLSKHPIEVTRGLPGDDSDEQSRYIEGVITQGTAAVRIASIYLPNGNPIGTDKFSYKLAWMDRLIAHTAHLLTYEEPLILAGDYNVIPSALDCKNPADWSADALFQSQTRQRFQALQNLGLTDALRACSDQASLYTFWDYQAGAFQRNNGIRIDHLLLSPQAADRLESVEIDRFTRALEKPSDHVPIKASLKF